MHQRGAPECDYNIGQLPSYVRFLIDTFLTRGVCRSDTLFWKVLGLARREEGARHLIEEVTGLPPKDSQMLFCLAQRWLPSVEYGMFVSKVKQIRERKMLPLQLKVPFGRVKRVQVFLKNNLKSAL